MRVRPKIILPQSVFYKNVALGYLVRTRVFLNHAVKKLKNLF